MRYVKSVFCVLLLCAVVGIAGDHSVATSTSSTSTDAELVATTKYLKGHLEQVSIRCPDSVTADATITGVPRNTNAPSFTILTTNTLSGNVSLYPESVAGHRFFLWGDALQVAFTNVTDSNVTYKVTAKVSGE